MCPKLHLQNEIISLSLWAAWRGGCSFYTYANYGGWYTVGAQTMLIPVLFELNIKSGEQTISHQWTWCEIFLSHSLECIQDADRSNCLPLNQNIHFLPTILFLLPPMQHFHQWCALSPPRKQKYQKHFLPIIFSHWEFNNIRLNPSTVVKNTLTMSSLFLKWPQ